jgi:hypothetical protein
MTFRLTFAVLVLAPSITLAEAHADKAAALIAAIEANGCLITDANAMTILEASGVPMEEAEGIMDMIGEAGEAPDATVRLVRNDDGTTGLISPNCPAQ